MEREPVRVLDPPSCPRQVYPEPSQGIHLGRGPSPPWQSDPRRSCAPSPSPAPWTSAGAAAWPGTGRPVLLQQLRPRPPATPSLEGTGGGRVLTPTSPSLSQPLIPAPAKQDLLSYLAPFAGYGPGPEGTGTVVQPGPSPGPLLGLPVCLSLCTPLTAQTCSSARSRPCFNPLHAWCPNVPRATSKLLSPGQPAPGPAGLTLGWLCPPCTWGHMQPFEHPKLFHASVPCCPFFLEPVPSPTTDCSDTGLKILIECSLLSKVHPAFPTPPSQGFSASPQQKWTTWCALPGGAQPSSPWGTWVPGSHAPAVRGLHPAHLRPT